MPISYKIKGGPALMMLIFGAAFLSMSAPMVMNFIALIMADQSFGNGPGPILALIFSLFPLSGLVILILGIRRMVTPLIVLDEQGVTIKKFFKSYQFNWSELDSINYFRTRYPFFGRRGLTYRESYDFLSFHAPHRPAVEVEISFLDSSIPILISQLRDRVPQFYDYSAQ